MELPAPEYEVSPREAVTFIFLCSEFELAKITKGQLIRISTCWQIKTIDDSNEPS